MIVLPASLYTFGDISSPDAMVKAISDEINDIVPERWTEIVSKATEYFDTTKTYSVDVDKHGQWGGLSIRCSAPTEKEVKNLVLFALKLEKPDESG